MSERGFVVVVMLKDRSIVTDHESLGEYAGRAMSWEDAWDVAGELGDANERVRVGLAAVERTCWYRVEVCPPLAEAIVRAQFTEAAQARGQLSLGEVG